VGYNCPTQGHELPGPKKNGKKGERIWKKEVRDRDDLPVKREGEDWEGI